MLSSLRPGLWHKAKKVVLAAGQTEVKVSVNNPMTQCCKAALPVISLVVDN